MKSYEEFKQFYDAELLPGLQPMEAERKKLIRCFFLIAFTPALCIALKLFLVFQKHFNIYFFLIILFFTLFAAGLSAFAFYVIYGKRLVALKKRFRNEVIAKMVKFLDKSLTYSPEEFISKSEYEKSKLFLTGIVDYSGHSLVSGKIGKTSVRFSEIHSEHKTGPKDRNLLQVIFAGIFFTADFNKYFKTSTVILPDTAENLFGSFGTELQKMNLSRDRFVKMEDSEFEKLFVVYSEDQTEARYLLSPALMQQITGLRKKTGKNIYLSFAESRLHIAVRTGGNLFEAPFFHSMLDSTVINEYFHYLKLMHGITEELDLNTRIWTKE